MKRLAVLDIGSHSVLLLIAEQDEKGVWQPLVDLSRITRLGEGLGTNRRLQSEAVQRTLLAVDEYLLLCREWEVDQILTVGTAVLREARNREVLSQPLEARGLALQILSPEEESRLSFLSVWHDPALGFGKEVSHPEEGQAPLAVVDIGGGSVEVGIGAREAHHFSFPMGAVLVRAKLLPSDPPTSDELLRACVELDRMFAPLEAFPQPQRVVTVGGTGVNLGSVWLGLETFDPSRLHGLKLKYEDLGQLLARFCSLPESERRLIKGLEPDRASVIHAGTLILERTLHALRQEEVLISVRGWRYGLLPRGEGKGSPGH